MRFNTHLMIATNVIFLGFLYCLTFGASPDVLIGIVALAILYMLKVIIVQYDKDIRR